MRVRTILDACADPNLFGPWFCDRDASWEAWFGLLAALFGLPLSPQRLATYQRCTGRTEPPTAASTEAWLVCGRRAGKSFVLALIAVWLACFHEWRQFLALGERGTVLVIANDRRQARTILRYVRGLLTNVPMLARMIEREAAESFDLSNGVTIEVAAASFRTVRGYTIVAALLDEIAFYRGEDSAAPDYELLDALRPGMATVPGAMLLCASSPYARRGALWDAHRRHYGKDGDPVLVWQAPTRDMNPTVPQRVIDEAMERDPASAAAEYLAQFRSDLETFVSRDVIHALVQWDVRELPPMASQKYFAFVDPSGGSANSFTLAVAHREGTGAEACAVLDACRERRPPFSPEAVAAEFAELLKSYRVTTVSGDRYAGEWPREQFRKHGVRYSPSVKPKSDIYRDCLPLLNASRVRILDEPRLIAQLCGLERRVGRGGRDSIDHSPGAHDDLCNAACGALLAASCSASAFTESLMKNTSDPGDRVTPEWLQQLLSGHGR